MSDHQSGETNNKTSMLSLYFLSMSRVCVCRYRVVTTTAFQYSGNVLAVVCHVLFHVVSCCGNEMYVFVNVPIKGAVLSCFQHYRHRSI